MCILLIIMTPIPQSVRVCPPQFPVDILLELSHVKHPQGLLDIHQPLLQLHRVVAYGAILGVILDKDLTRAQAFQQNVSTLIHLDFSALSDHFLELFCLWIPHRIRESVETQPVNEYSCEMY